MEPPTETRPELVVVAQEAPPPQPPEDPTLQSLMCKSCTLKVSIHCQGCLRKVRKVLHSIDGVYKTTIDLKQQKVEVMGNVDTDTLIKILTQTGKRAELWPDTEPIKKKKKKKKKKKPKPENNNQSTDQKQSDGESSDEGNQTDGNKNEAVKVVVQDTAPRNPATEGCGGGGGGGRIVEGGWPTGRGGVQFQEMKPEVRHVMTFPAGNQLPVAEKKVTMAVENGAGNDGGYRRNRIYYKGQRGNNEGLNVSFEPSGDWNQNQMHGSGPYGNGPGPGPGTVSFMGPPNESPPRNQYPPHYHAPGSPPMCGGSFHTAYPSSMKYSASYYTSSQPYSYAYTHQSNDSDSESYTYTTRSRGSRPSSSFELFSDENPNACSVM